MRFLMFSLKCFLPEICRPNVVCNENLHNMDSKFLVPPSGFPQSSMIGKQFVGLVDARHVLVVDVYKIWLQLGFSIPLIDISGIKDISVILPFGHRNVIQRLGYYFLFLWFLCHYLLSEFYVWSQGTSNVGFLLGPVLCYRIIPVYYKEMVTFIKIRFHKMNDHSSACPSDLTSANLKPE